MPATVDQTWVYRFHDRINLTYQQRSSITRGLVDPMMVHRDVHAQVDHHERMGAVMANDNVNPFGAMQILNPAHSRRACRMQSSDGAVLVSDEHSLRAMVNPQSAYTETIIAALLRREDKHVIDALVGTAEVASVTAGSGTITYANQVLPSSQIIGAATAMDLARIIAAGVKLSKASVPMGPSVRKFLYSPGQESDIMAITQASSSDFTKHQIHDRGTLSGLSWQGFYWECISDVVNIDLTVIHRMLPLTSVTRRCIAFHNAAFGISIGRAQGAPSISIRHDLQSEPIQVRQAMMMAAVRVFEGGVVAVDALEN